MFCFSRLHLEFLTDSLDGQEEEEEDGGRAIEIGESLGVRAGMALR